MKIKTMFIALALLLLRGVAFGQTATEPVEATFKLNVPDLAPETRKNLVTAFEPGFSKKAGGDLFVVKLGPDKIRYEYLGEWIEFEPLNHLPTLAAVTAANELYHESYWLDTNLRFTVRDYGVKVDIILLSAAAPREFSFRYSKSAGWQDEWIRPAFAYDGSPFGHQVKVVEALSADRLTYTLPAISKETLFPVTIDPTFNMSSGNDDTRGHISAGTDANNVAGANGWFGRYEYLGVDYSNWTFMRWPVTIPRASKIISANISFKNGANYTGAFNTTVEYLAPSGSPAWRDTNGFAVGNYADCTALLAISKGSPTVAWNSVANWPSVGTRYDSPEIKTLLQPVVDDLANYDPVSATDKYFGITVDDGDGTYRPTNPIYSRSWDAYDDVAAGAAELDVTYDPWGEIMVCGGYKVDGDELKYYGY